MSYVYEQQQGVIAAEARADARATFIRKTYAHVAGAILAFVLLETVLLHIPGIENLIAPMVSSRIAWLVVMVLFMGLTWVAERWANSSTSKGIQYAGLGLCVAAWGIVFLPMLYIAAAFSDATVIPTAAILTLSVFGGLTAAVLMTGKDFSFLGPILSITSFLVLGLIVAAAIFGFSLGLIFSFFMVAFASAAILYQTSNVLHRYNTEQYVAASVTLFGAVALLFWYVLQIAMEAQRGR